MNVEIGAEATLFSEKEYINRIAVAVQQGEFFMFSNRFASNFFQHIFWQIGQKNEFILF